MQAVLPAKTGGQIGRILKRLRLHGLIKKIGKTYKYYLTELGQRAVLVGLKLKEHLIVPVLAAPRA
jgi:DNA-binding PadR family transcriptional regulator